RERLTTRARQIAHEVIRVEEASSTLQRLRRARLVEQVVALVLADRAEMDETGRRFVGAEVSFGDAGAAWPALVLGAGSEAVHVQGRIDRWDVVVDARGPASAVVVDYKSAPLEGATVESFFHGKGSVQLAIYARAVAAHADLRPTRVDGRYFGYRRAALGKPIGHARGDDALW